ncbi:6252_t:CDS:2 [Ambispora leptoticha]|uniref:6252_t:CDS:1 n=1 Tax=Ambispora leptoticha TaxID=144679 RepID=A0A9N9A4R7_9GLOM|nr:6252_t:CDS:2 [Ambispora leptoticha]
MEIEEIGEMDRTDEMDLPTYNFVNGVPTDPQVLKVYNGLSRIQMTAYNKANDQGKTYILYVVADEKKKPRHYLNLLYAVINLLSVTGFNIWSHFQRRDGDEDFIKYWNNYKPEQDVILMQLCILFGTQIMIIAIASATEGLFNKYKFPFIFVPIIIGIGLAVLGGLTWTLPSIAISFVGVGILFAESAIYYFSIFP